jgi:hypothetical protein
MLKERPSKTGWKLAVNKVFAPWRIDQPFALGWGEWKKYDAEQKERYPVRWYLFRTIPRWFDFQGYRLDRWKWAVIHRVVPKHKYHHIHTSLEPGYHDPQSRILYATMDLICEFVEHTMDTVEWEATEGHSHAHKEMLAIHKWWTEEYPTYDNAADVLPHIEFDKIFEDGNEDDPEKIAWNEACEVYQKLEVDQDKKTEEMLVRAAKIRQYLWYP